MKAKLKNIDMNSYLALDDYSPKDKKCFGFRLIVSLSKAKQEQHLDRCLQQMANIRVLLIDEIGYLPMNRHEASPFFQLLNRRYEKASIILTSNKSFIDWGELFGDPILATAILDRLLHHSTTLNIKGDSYRLKEKRKAGLLGQNRIPTQQLLAETTSCSINKQ